MKDLIKKVEALLQCEVIVCGNYIYQDELELVIHVHRTVHVKHAHPENARIDVKYHCTEAELVSRLSETLFVKP